MPNKTIVNATTGEISSVPMTADDLAQRAADIAEQKKIMADRDADENARNAVLVKLAAVAGVDVDAVKRAVGAGRTTPKSRP